MGWDAPPWSSRWPGRKVTAGLRRHRRFKQWCVHLAYLAQRTGERPSLRARPRCPNLLKLARAAHDRTFRQLADATGISAATWCRVENEFAAISLSADQVHRLTVELGASYQMLFCLSPYGSVREALDKMMGFQPFRKARIRKIARTLRQELERISTAPPAPSSTPVGTG